MIEIKPLNELIYLGKRGENLARIICFDELDIWEKIFGKGECELIHQRCGDSEPYPVKLECENHKICWIISASDTDLVGKGKCELRYKVGDVIVKSKTWTTIVYDSLGDNVGDVPKPQQSWVDEVLNEANKVKNATTHQPIIGENKNWYVWNVETMKYEDSGILAEASTPIKGVDYWNNEDKQEIMEDIQPTLENNLKSAKDYTDNSIARNFKNISYDETTATFIFTRHDNTRFTVDLPIEQTVKDGRYDEETQELVLVLVSGQEIRIPASGLIDDYTGVDSATIQLSISADNKITANIIAGTISKTLLTTELQQELDNKINNTDYATSSKAGIMRPANGLFTSGTTGAVLIAKASNEKIDGLTDNYYPIVPSNLVYAVKVALNSGIATYDEETETLSINTNQEVS